MEILSLKTCFALQEILFLNSLNSDAEISTPKISTMQTPQFGTPDDSIIFGMVEFDMVLTSEYLYYCVDTARGAGLLKLLIKAGIPVPLEV